MTAVRIKTKRKKDQSLTRSANAPDTMEAAAATKTIWKNQSDMVEKAFSPARTAAASPSPLTSAISSADGP